MSEVKTYVIKVGDDDPQRLMHAILETEQRANAMGLFPAARALNNARNAIGWQLTGDIAAADEASTRRL